MPSSTCQDRGPRSVCGCARQQRLFQATAFKSWVLLPLQYGCRDTPSRAIARDRSTGRPAFPGNTARMAQPLLPNSRPANHHSTTQDSCVCKGAVAMQQEPLLTQSDTQGHSVRASARLHPHAVALGACMCGSTHTVRVQVPATTAAPAEVCPHMRRTLSVCAGNATTQGQASRKWQRGTALTKPHSFPPGH